MSLVARMSCHRLLVIRYMACSYPFLYDDGTMFYDLLNHNGSFNDACWLFDIDTVMMMVVVGVGLHGEQ